LENLPNESLPARPNGGLLQAGMLVGFGMAF
jgi:hypothetical protein